MKTIKQMNTQELLHMDFDEWNKLSVSEMKSAVSKLRKTANARLSRLVEKKMKTPARTSLEKSGGKISSAVSGKTEKETLSKLRKEFFRAKSFLEAETSTISGYKAVKKRTIENLGLNKNITDKQYERLWSTYEKLKEQNPEVESRTYRYTILKTLSNEIVENPSFGVDRMVERMNRIMENDDLYRQMIDEMDDEDNEGFSEFFEM